MTSAPHDEQRLATAPARSSTCPPEKFDTAQGRGRSAHRRQRRTGRADMLLTALAVLICGCPPPRDLTPVTRREALLRVNDNLARLDRPVQYAAVVSFRFVDSEGRTRSFVGHDARLLFAPPQSLLFDVRSLAGTVAQFGSNDERYWVWIEPEVNKLWWGRWDQSREQALEKLPVPPNELMDALLLRPLPETLEGGLLPVLRKADDDCRLLFVRLGIDRQPSGMREIQLDPRPPHQPLEIVDWLPDGQVAMHAILRDYQRIGADGPYTPRRYIVTWPRQRAEMRLDVLRATFRLDIGSEVFEFPTGWRGETEQIDAEPARPSACSERPATP